jgi:hypothetical protein
LHEVTARQYTSSALAAVIGIVVFARSVGLGVIDATRLDWIFLGGIDPSFHFAGWHMFRYEPWTFPLGAVHSFGYPVGTSIALTDSIPIFALPFKAATALLPSDFQYLGLWLLLCFVFQGLFGALLVRTVTKSVALQTLGATLFVLSPLLVHRVTHAALTAHWLVLASLWLYFDNGPSSTRLRVSRWLCLVAVAAATQPYLAVMVLAVAAAALVRHGRLQPSQWMLVTLIPGAVLVTATVLIWWITGYFIVSERADLEAVGFGTASMNLLSPMMPLDFSVLFGRGPFVMANPVQNEGFSYLGAGTLFLLVVSLIARRPHWPGLRAWIAAHSAFLVVCGVLILLALSPRITLGAGTVMEYDPRWWGPLIVFRSSGRMIWPVYYAITFAAVAVLTRLPARRAIALLAIAVALQAIDLSDAYRVSREGRATRMPAMPFSSPFWKAAVPQYKHLVLDPTNMCATQGPSIDYRFLALHAGPALATINGGYSGRHDVQKVVEYCKSFADDIKSGRVSHDSLYVTLPKLAPALTAAAQQPLACTVVDLHAVCFTRASYARWQEQFDVVRDTLPPASEFREFRHALEAEYRDRMRRPAVGAPGSIDDRLRTVVEYLAYRSRGCGHEEAVVMVVGAPKGEHQPRLCSTHTFTGGPLPPTNETMDFRRQVNAAFRARAAEGSEPTHVDEEGEVVWVEHYAQERLNGRSHPEATRRVLDRIRAIAP